MKAITICQPYAHLIAVGDKRIENRRWGTRFRGPLLIHAGKTRDWLDPDVDDVSQMVFGAVVATADLMDCVKIIDLRRTSLWAELIEQAERGYATGPWCWILAQVRKLPEPYPARGKQGLWDLPWPPDRR